MSILDTCGTEYVFGKGKVYFAHRALGGGAIDGPWVEVGDSDSLTLNTSVTREEHKESCSGRDQVVTSVITEQRTEFAVNTFNFSKEMLGVALLGDESTVTGASVTDEAFTLYDGDTLLFARHPDISAVTITNTAGSTTLVDVDDYSVDGKNGAVVFTSAGLAKLTASGTNKTGLIDYTYASYEDVQGLTQTEQEYAIKFIGTNKINGEAVHVDIHRVRLSPAATLALIGTTNASYELSGLLLPDSSQTSGDSQYFKIAKTV